MRQEISPPHTKEFLVGQIRRSLFLTRQNEKMKIEPDSSLSYLYSSRVHKVLFGRESVEAFKVQAGTLIPLRPKELRGMLSPMRAEFMSRPQEPIQFSHVLQLASGRRGGYTRQLSVTNRSDGVVRMRLLTAHDPTSMNFRRDRDPAGEIGVNAFNRGDHVVMDDVGDTTGARVIGFSSQPSIIYMTKDRQRAVELLAAGEVPDGTAGMSGPIVIIAQHDFELAPGRIFELSMGSLYHDSSLAEALSEFAGLLSGGALTPPEVDQDAVFGCSNPSIGFGWGWAKAALHSIEGEPDLSERIFAGFALGVVRPAHFEDEFETTKGLMRRDGLVPRTAERGGPLETSLFIVNSCSYLHMKGDRRLSRKWYPALRKAGNALVKASKDGLIHSGASQPDGWRRRLGSGFPTGITSEVNIVASRALKELAATAYGLGKGSDSAAFAESSVRISGQVNERLRDAKTGSLALNIDPRGRSHPEQTVDQAVALSYHPFDRPLASSLVHRLLEKDFESGYGPRCIPSSNPLYYNPSYGDGQLGSCWTRGTLAHSVLAYLTGYPNIGGAQLERVARLVHSDWEQLGGAPGEFPYWLDSERRSVMGVGSDSVAAGRFIEALLLGEMGLGFAPDGLSLDPPASSRLRWALVHDLTLGEKGSIFVGRPRQGSWVASSFKTVRTTSTEFQGCELVENSRGHQAIMFWDRSSIVVCAGNSGTSTWSGNVWIPVNGKPLATSLFGNLEELDQESSTWKNVGRMKLPGTFELHLNVEASAWQAHRLTRV